MTSINALTDNRYAYLTTDSAIYDPTGGRVVAFGPKAIALPALSMVLAFSGRWFGLEEVVVMLDRNCPVSVEPRQADVLAAIVPTLREMSARSKSDGLIDGFRGGAVSVTIALYDHGQQAPRIFYAYAKGAPEPATPEPFKLEEIPGILSPPIGPEGEHEIWPAGYLKLPRREFSKLLSAQRRFSASYVANGCALGGTCHFFRIGAEGIYSDDLISFPDAMGEPMNPEVVGQHIPSRLDLAFAT